MCIIMLDGREMTDKATAHTYLKKMLNLPEHYGRNLDALYDCLLELKRCRIVITHVAELREHLQQYAQGILHVFEAAAEENPNLSVVREDGTAKADTL